MLRLRESRDTIRDNAAIRERRERRVKTHASQAQAELSKTRKRTACLGAFLEYVRVRGIHRASLAAAYTSRAARSDAFEEGRLRTSQVDRFINRVIDGGVDGKSFRENIAGPEDLLYWGEGNGTKSAMLKRRIDSAFKHVVKHLWVNESGSTKFDCMTGRELDFAKRKITLKRDGKTRWVKDRDVRFRKPEDALGPPHPFPISPDSLGGKGFEESDPGCEAHRPRLTESPPGGDMKMNKSARERAMLSSAWGGWWWRWQWRGRARDRQTRWRSRSR